jgi:hypothetical protein
MARRPEIRVSYHNDMAFLIRLRDAIQRDPKQTPEWKAATIQHIDALAKLFVGAKSDIPASKIA